MSASVPTEHGWLEKEVCTTLYNHCTITSYFEVMDDCFLFD